MHALIDAFAYRSVRDFLVLCPEPRCRWMRASFAHPVPYRYSLFPDKSNPSLGEGFEQPSVSREAADRKNLVERRINLTKGRAHTSHINRERLIKYLSIEPIGEVSACQSPALCCHQSLHDLVLDSWQHNFRSFKNEHALVFKSDIAETDRMVFRRRYSTMRALLNYHHIFSSEQPKPSTVANQSIFLSRHSKPNCAT